MEGFLARLEELSGGFQEAALSIREEARQRAVWAFDYCNQYDIEKFLREAQEVHFYQLEDQDGEAPMCPLGAAYIMKKEGMLKNNRPVFSNGAAMQKVSPELGTEEGEENIVISFSEFRAIVFCWPDEDEWGVFIKCENGYDYMLGLWKKDGEYWFPNFEEEANSWPAIRLVP